MIGFMPRCHRACVGLAVVSLISVMSGSAEADTRLADAVKSQNSARARQLVAQGVDVNSTQPDGATALHWAAQWNDREMVELLLKAGAKVNVSNDYGATPLALAALNSSAALVQRLLEAGADPNLGLATGETPLMTAARTGSVEAVRALASRGASLEARESFRGQTALMWALSERHLKTAQALIELGADVSARSASGFTPLMFLAREGDLESARLLLSRGADVNAVASGDGSTALIVATVRGHTDLALWLLDHGADPNLSAPGYTPLHWAAGKWESVFTWDYQHAVGEWGRLIGVRDKRTDLIKALVSRGANVNARTTKQPPRFGYSIFGATNHGGRLVGVTPFYLAAVVGDVEVMRLLLAAGADPSIPSSEGTTALIAAAGLTRLESESRQPESGFLEASRLCVSLGLDVRASNELGVTPMHAASIAGFDSVVAFLAEQGADVNARSKAGQTPLSLAIKYEIAMTTFDHPTTAALLRKLGGVE